MKYIDDSMMSKCVTMYDSMTCAYINILAKFGVVGIEKDFYFEDVCEFCRRNNLEYNHNTKKKLIWFVSAVTPELEQLFLHNYKEKKHG